MDIKGAHEDAHQDAGPLQVLLDNVVDGGRHPLLDGDRGLMGFHFFDVDHRAVRRADQVIAMRGLAGWVAKEPEVTPKAKACQGQNQQDGEPG